MALENITLADAGNAVVFLAATVTAIAFLLRLVVNAVDRRIQQNVQSVKDQVNEKVGKLQATVDPVASQINHTGFKDLERKVEKILTLMEVYNRRHDRLEGRLDKHMEGHS